MDSAAGRKNQFAGQDAVLQVRRHRYLLMAVWVGIIFLVGLNDYLQEQHQVREMAMETARSYFMKDQAYRFWASSHGGVYVPADKRTPPNPYLTNVREKNIFTESGRHLTLMNPAYMMRQVMQEYADLYGVKGRLTSLKPLNPANSPDDWERDALLQFENGIKEVAEFVDIDGESYARLMRPMVTREDCLKCHAHQGYKVGDIRGGVSLAVPMKKYQGLALKELVSHFVTLLAFGFFGLIAIFLFMRRIHVQIVKRYATMKDLHTSESRLAEAQRIANLGSWRWNIEEDRLSCSSECLRVMNLSPTDKKISFETFIEKISPEDKENFIAEINAATEGKKKLNTTFEVIGRQGSARVVHAQAEVTGDDSGKPMLMSGTVQDITERLLESEHREQLEKQLRQSQKMETIGTLTGGIAHDFNNILMPIMGFSEIARESVSPDDKETIECLEQIEISAKRAKDLVAQLLTFGRQGEQERKPLSLRPIIKETIKLLRATLPATITIQQDIISNGRVLADPSQMHQVVMNLCTNAYQAMGEEGGVLRISLDTIESGEPMVESLLSSSNKKYVRLTISDTGSGMDEQTKERIFEPFFTTKRPGQGTGLGLSVVHGIVKSHGGEIMVESLGRGSSFHVFLPIIEKSAVDLPVAQEEVPGGRERILLVDDEVAIVKLVKRILEGLGYSVVGVSDSTEALELFRQEPDRFDLVITDQIMPIMTGRRLTRELFRIRNDIPVILVTGMSEQVTPERSAELGIREVLMKPWTTLELSRAIRRVLDNEE
jgi:signal transduction histidine kinase/ActR/RegA family two-component response regulator